MSSEQKVLLTPSDIKTLNDVAIYLANAKQDKMAEQVLEIASRTDDPIITNNLGKLYRSQKKPDLAIRYFESSAKKRNYKAFLSIGDILCERKEYDEAERAYKKCSNKLEGLLKLGKLCEDKKDYVNAKAYYEEAIIKGNYKGLLYLGQMILNEGKEDCAKIAEEKFLEARNKGVLESPIYLACLYHNVTKDYKKAEENYLAAIHCGLGNRVYYSLSNLYEETGMYNPELAMKYYMLFRNNERSIYDKFDE